jgi:hypothetical protein
MEHTDEQPWINEQLAEGYKKLIDVAQHPPQTILYPCSRLDVTPSTAFPEAAVTYIDAERDVVKKLLHEGYDAHCAWVPAGRPDEEGLFQEGNLPAFSPRGETDLLILLNPQIAPFEVVRWVRRNGYVICNNYHSTADEMHTCKDFSPIAMLDISTHEVATQGITDCFELITTDAEYMTLAPEAYKKIQRFMRGRLRTLFPGIFDVSHVIQEYLEKARGRYTMFDTVFIGKHRLPRPLRKKDSNADDLFLFRKLQ